MPVKRDADLKRPDLRGEFPCGYCGAVSKHLASLNRHLRQAHSAEQKCLICVKNLEKNETAQTHMRLHDIKPTFTCGCCQNTFRTKKDIYAHKKSMKLTGQPGPVQPIAIGSLPPGFLNMGHTGGAANNESDSGRGSANKMALSPLSTESEEDTTNEVRLLEIINLLADTRNIPMKKSPPSSSSNRRRKAAVSVENPCMDDVIDLLVNAPKKAKISPERQAELHNKRKSIHDIISNLQSRNEKKPDPLS